MKLKLDLINKEIQDQYTRENFFRIKRELENQQILDGFWNFFEVEFLQAGTDLPIKHNLSFTPKDIIILAVEGDHNMYFRYEKFDSTNVYITVAGPCRVRFLAGAYNNKAYGNSSREFPFVAPNTSGGSGSQTTLPFTFCDVSLFFSSLYDLFLTDQFNEMLTNEAGHGLVYFGSMIPQECEGEFNEALLDQSGKFLFGSDGISLI